MDTSIIGVALPDMRQDLGFSQGGLQWVFNAYAVALGGLLLLGGRLSDLSGARKIFSTGWAILIAGSVVAAAGHPGGRPRAPSRHSGQAWLGRCSRWPFRGSRYRRGCLRHRGPRLTFKLELP
ncbi:MFS transporter [Streptosporangium roseum]|uniref:MFS transporter n=1 Tax=Streptosporangium roseum TaxID=2001 RepID=UPI003322CACF